MGSSEWRKTIASKVPPPLLAVYGSIRRRRDRNQRKRTFRQHLRLSDVFIVGHPKSGNTWLAYMLAILFHEDYEHRVTLANIAAYIPFIHGHDNAIANYPDLPNPRIFRNEWPVYPELYPKTIYVVRDPRAVLVSYYYHYQAVTADSRKTLQAFVEEYLTQGQIRNFDTQSARWDRQVFEWIERTKKDGRVMIVRYEDMVHDRRDILKRVVKHIGVPCSEEDIALVTARGSFEAMRSDEEQHGAESYPGEMGKRGSFIRRGKADGWVEEMPRDLIEKIDQKFSRTMEKAGYL